MKTLLTKKELEKAEHDYLDEDFSVNAIRLNRGHTEDFRLRVAKAQNLKTRRMIIKYLDQANDTRDLDRRLQTLKKDNE